MAYRRLGLQTYIAIGHPWSSRIRAYLRMQHIMQSQHSARPIGTKATLPRIAVTGDSCDLGYVDVEMSGIVLHVRLTPDGEARLPSGVTLPPETHAAVETAAHAAYVEEVVKRFALQREKRLSVAERRADAS
jgi:hypothetical protein